MATQRLFEAEAWRVSQLVVNIILLLLILVVGGITPRAFMVQEISTIPKHCTYRLVSCGQHMLVF